MEAGLLTDASAPFALGAISLGVIAAAAVLAIAAIGYLFVKLTGSDSVFARARTEQRRAEQLAQQSQHFNIALNSVSQGIVMFDAKERVVVCNQRYLELSGLSADFVQPGRTF